MKLFAWDGRSRFNNSVIQLSGIYCDLQTHIPSPMLYDLTPGLGPESSSSFLGFMSWTRAPITQSWTRDEDSDFCNLFLGNSFWQKMFDK